MLARLRLGLPLLFLLTACTPSAGQEGGAGWQITSIDIGSAGGGLAAGDLNGDGALDLAVSSGGEVLVLSGDGSGSFRPHGRTPAGSHPVDFALADLDEDGALDLAVANHDTEYITVLFGDGRGGFRPGEDSHLRLGLDPHPHAVRTADIDLDGHIDLLVDERGREGVRVLRGRGDGSFELPGTLVPVGDDLYRGMALGDLNGDGRPDMVTPNRRDAGVLLNEPEGGLRRVGSVAASSPFGIALADLNGDGNLDLVTGSEGGDLDVFRGRGDGSFDADGVRRRVPGGGKKIASGDLNGDGIDDAVVINYMSTEILLLMGGSEEVTSIAVDGRHPWGLAVADLDGDGREDLAVGDEGTNRLYILLSRLPG